MSKKRRHADDLRAATKLVVTATHGVLDVVEDMHRTIASGPAVLGRPLVRPATAITRALYGNIGRVTGLVGDRLDAALAGLGPWLGQSSVGANRDALLSVVNGVLGDYLVATENPLAIPMTFRSGGEPIALDTESIRTFLQMSSPSTDPSKLLILVHGSSMNDRQWLRAGHDHGAALARDLGFTPIYLHYNTGLHISTNGRLFAERLDDLVRAWPVPLSDLSIVGHSMGGLVARSAASIAEEAHLPWRSLLKRLVFLGSPHHGSPIERGGSWVDTLLDLSSYSSPLSRLGHIRSAGVTDLRYGYVIDADWEGRGRFTHTADARRGLSLPNDVACFAIAASTAKEAPLDAKKKLPGDGLVPIDSALGRHKRGDLTLAFPAERQSTVFGVTHLDLLNNLQVYERLRAAFASTVASPQTDR